MTLAFVADWERAEVGSAEERACYAAVGVSTGNGRWLTEAEDAFVKTVRQRVHLSAYALAEWLAWNYWRLSHEAYEPHARRRRDWPMAHRLTTIGGGYVWPNITIFSDGERVALVARPTREVGAEPLRYLSDSSAIVSVAEFQEAAGRFIEQVIGKLRAENVPATNLDRTWRDVLAERTDVEIALARQLEAVLGFEPDRAPAGTLEALLLEARSIGQGAMLELAATRIDGADPLTLAQLDDAAREHGADSQRDDMVRMRDIDSFYRSPGLPAWRCGSDAAQVLRTQERLGERPVADGVLASLAGVGESVLDQVSGAVISFAMAHADERDRLVLRRNHWKTGRRFDLARLLGDQLANSTEGSLFPATNTGTYRQKWQRSFAAELLCPVEVLSARLDGDFSAEAIEREAQYFDVSSLAVHTILVNNNLLERRSLADEAVIV